MLFHTPEFLVFFLVYVLFHQILGGTVRLYVIVIGSIFFYGYWYPPYVAVPILMTLFAWLGGIVISGAKNRLRRNWLALFIILLLLPLLFYKYTDFFWLEIVGPLLPGQPKQVLGLALPLGISFVTFTLISYLVEVYRCNFPVQRSGLIFAGYVLFFPQLIAGPIVRPKQLIPQLHNIGESLRPRLLLGAAIYTLGMVKKVMFADQAAGYVDSVYAAGAVADGVNYLLAFYLFPLQIYCDFSGYTDMAIGLGLILGVRLPTNFQRPYAAASIDEFWRRWHISLSSWLRDYLYISLGGNRRGEVRRYANIMFTMLIGGLWHGASWTFVAWGGLHGLAIAGSHAWAASRRRWSLPRIPRPIGIFVTFHVASVLWVFFRAPDFMTVERVLLGIVGGGIPAMERLGQEAFYLFLLTMFALMHRFDSIYHVRGLVRHLNHPALWGFIVAVWCYGLLLQVDSSREFIYFQF